VSFDLSLKTKTIVIDEEFIIDENNIIIEINEIHLTDVFVDDEFFGDEFINKDDPLSTNELQAALSEHTECVQGQSCPQRINQLPRCSFCL